MADTAITALVGTNTINSTEYRIWAGMIQRCTNPNHRAYKWYGERGIKVCQRWRNFDNFYSDMGVRPHGLTLDRKDNNGNYEPNNCKWSTIDEQLNNKRRQSNLISIIYEGEVKYLVDVCEEISFSYKVARQRYHRRWLDSELFLSLQQGNQYRSYDTCQIRQ